MTPSELFYESRIHAQHVVYGYQLRDLCLLDLVAFEAVCSPIVRDYRQISAVDLALAARLLSKPHRRDCKVDATSMRASEDFVSRLASFDPKEQLARFEAYWVRQYTQPLVDRGIGASGEPLGSHWAQTLAAFLSRETNLAQYEIWAGPIGQIMMLTAAIEEQLTSARVQSDREHEADMQAEATDHSVQQAKHAAIVSLQELLLSAESDTERNRIRISSLCETSVHGI